MKLLMAANWKMYKNRAEAAAFLRDLTKRLDPMPEDREIAVFAPFTALGACADAMDGGTRIRLGGQDCWTAEQGAFTGEISPAMLRDCGCSLVLTGHSERRAIVGEGNALVGAKTAFALASGLDVILCVGETLEQRELGALDAVISRQLEEGLAGVPDNGAPERMSVAYEPVWAIGTGKTAGSEEIVAAHALVRQRLADRFGGAGGAKMRILYGGSVKPENAAQIISLDNVDGLLIGGASLLVESFARIVTA